MGAALNTPWRGARFAILARMITYEVTGRTAVFTINRPMPAMPSTERWPGLEAAVERFEADDEMWTAVLLVPFTRGRRPQTLR